MPIREAPAEPQLEPDRASALDDRRAIVEAMEYAAGGGSRCLQDREHVVARAALVDHERQAQLVGQRDLGSEPALLVLARGVVTIEIEPGLADGHDPRMPRVVAE